MSSFHEIADRLKEAIAVLEDRDKIRDKDLAGALGLTPQYYAVIKRRERIPYEAIVRFCQRYTLSLHWVLLGQRSRIVDLEALKSYNKVAKYMQKEVT